MIKRRIYLIIWSMMIVVAKKRMIRMTPLNFQLYLKNSMCLKKAKKINHEFSVYAWICSVHIDITEYVKARLKKN